MKITAINIGKRFNQDWILKKVNLQFHQGNSYALLGPNGSGKSTLMKMLSGYLMPSEGELVFENPQKLEIGNVYKHISYTGPYIDLVDEFTVEEQLKFHHGFIKFIDNLQPDDLIQILKFGPHRHKELKNLSSGMRQRMKLILAIMSDVPVLLLDEPATNLDKEGVEWYLALVEKYAKDKLIVVASNRKDEYGFCNESINVLDFK